MSMVYIHKYFKIKSLFNVQFSQLQFVAASCVFLAAKVLYTPFSLDKAAEVFFLLERRRSTQFHAKASLS